MQLLSDQKKKLEQPLFLVGPMGSGKSTLGRALAEALQVPFIDVDEEIIKAEGRSIPDIFRTSGEGGFRDAESRTLASILDQHQELCVISGGGGVILREINRRIIVEKTTCVYLYCSPEVQFARVGGDSNRPMIASDSDQRQKLIDIFAIRDPLFRSMCHIGVDTSVHDLTSCVRYLVSSLY